MAHLVTPRVFIVRHGETEWSLNGRHTGSTDIPLTENGEKRITATGKALVGEDRLIVPSKLCHIYVSPRKRAQRTLELLKVGCKSRMPWADSEGTEEVKTEAEVEVTDNIREWDYGEYEGMLTAAIRQRRKEQGLGEKWNIWSDGCPGGESPEQITARIDAVIQDIRTKYHAPCIGKPEGECPPGDILVVAHGHLLRAFACRWIGRNIADNPALILEAGGVGLLSYEHHNLKEPALILGGAFTVPE